MSDFTIIDIPSPNFDSRPPGTTIDLVVIHAISLPPGKFGTGRVVDFFTNVLDSQEDPYFSGINGLKVSAHYFIERQGRVIRFVNDEKRAWHAGVSHFRGCDNCNDFSLGIELEGDDFNCFTEIQYQCLNKLLKFIKNRWPAVTHDRIVGHCHVAPQRKSDPGPFFDWNKIGVEFV
ncbi:MAG: 1,6-anhydro-N-acetylmuramyl-L-alanine amidase AmpD [Deltaproteobacteria bacterium]|nr:1,6-anhydro-N-acetylmuramyl-L-alanine amidase AmpD [Candidatus Tharpella sp.]